MGRLFDILFASIGLLISGPFILFGIFGIYFSSPGPVFYKAARVGRASSVFTMYKLRTMHVNQTFESAITLVDDARVFRFGMLLRASKIDELPQLFNILIGDMAIVGPRPEDPGIVKRVYCDWMNESLEVRPGLTSPGTLFAYVYGDKYLKDNDIEGSYSQELLPRKLIADIEYFKNSTIFTDVVVAVKTFVVILALLLGVPTPRLVPDMAKEKTLL